MSDQPQPSRPRFHHATTDDIRSGLTTDVYFERTVQIIREANLDRQVRAEFSVKSLPSGLPWAILAGLEEVYALLEGLDINVRGMPEGTIVRPYDPIMEIEGSYLSFAVLETAILGLLCESSGVATKAARIRHLAGQRILASFGARRMHPAVAPVIERAAFIGGCDGVSVVMAARDLGEDPTGTTPHALMLLVGDTVEAMQLYDRIVPEQARRIALIDTFLDEKFEAVRVAEALGDRLFGVRLDTPSSRRGNFVQILREVRWELDLRGYQHVQLIASGGLDETTVAELQPYVDGFGVGTSIANARTIDFGMDIIEIEGTPVSKRGKMSGAKQVWRDPMTLQDIVLPLGIEPKLSGIDPVLVPLIDGGTLVDPLPSVRAIRQRVLDQLLIVGHEVVPIG
ncbi:MAG TPA: nicotinate phosphoribosyltransferase [Thermomicrobiales bacterium]|nr:nicotinate phosphoribosyltransferase [Thermomicrobiales bacterium]